MPSIEQLKKVLAADPRDPFVLYGLAQEYAKAGHLREACEYYDRCLSVDPGYCYAYFHKARAQEAGGDAAAALATLRAGVEAARSARDGKALGELAEYLAMLEAGVEGAPGMGGA